MSTIEGETREGWDNMMEDIRKRCQKYSWLYLIYYIARRSQAPTHWITSKPGLHGAHLLRWNDRTREIITHLGVEEPFVLAYGRFARIEAGNLGTIAWKKVVKLERKLLRRMQVDGGDCSRHTTRNNSDFQHLLAAVPRVAINAAEDSSNQWFHPILTFFFTLSFLSPLQCSLFLAIKQFEYQYIYSECINHNSRWASSIFASSTTTSSIILSKWPSTWPSSSASKRPSRMSSTPCRTEMRATLLTRRNSRFSTTCCTSCRLAFCGTGSPSCSATALSIWLFSIINHMV